MRIQSEGTYSSNGRGLPSVLPSFFFVVFLEGTNFDNVVENGCFVVKNGMLLSASLTDTLEMVIYKKRILEALAYPCRLSLMSTFRLKCHFSLES